MDIRACATGKAFEEITHQFRLQIADLLMGWTNKNVPSVLKAQNVITQRLTPESKRSSQ